MKFLNLNDKPALRIAATIFCTVLVIYLFVMPMLGGTEDARLFTFTLMFTSIGVAINWNLTGGFTGYVDFGHAVWFGIGAYTTSILMSRQSDLVPAEWPLWPSVFIGVVVAGVIANLVGRMTLRLSGPYFSIAMLGFFVFMREVVRVWRPLTNGGVGLTLPPSIDRQYWYYVELVVVLLLIAASWWIRRSRFGATLIAIREDQVGAEMRGINTVRTKTTIFTVSAMSTGMFGGMWAYQNTFVDPDIAFVEVRTLDAVMGTMLGGLGTIIGPVIGSAVLYLGREVLWASFLDYHLIVQGVLLASIVLFLPKGLAGILQGEIPGLRRKNTGVTAFDDLREEAERAAGESSSEPPSGSASESSHDASATDDAASAEADRPMEATS